MSKSKELDGQQTNQTKPAKITALEKLMILLNVVYLTYPLGTVLFIFLVTRPVEQSNNPLAGVDSIPVYLFIVAVYAILATFAGLAALILDIVYLRKFRPTGKRKQLAIISLVSICVCAVVINFISPIISTL